MKISKKRKNELKKRMLISISIIAIVLVLLAVSKLAGFSAPFNLLNLAGSGARLENTETTIYIYDVNDMVTFRNSVNAGNDYAGKTVYLMNDIDLSTVCGEDVDGEEISWTPIGSITDQDATPVEGDSFAGNFDGKYHTINNLYINTDDAWVGLFANNTGIIQNLKVNGYVHSSEWNVGAIVAYNQNTMRNCHNACDVEAYGSAGGVSGDQSENGRIENCSNIGNISVSTNYAAGIAVSGGNIKNCYNKGTISAGSGAAAGIIGLETLDVYNCYNRGDTYGQLYIGGISAQTGFNESDVIDIRNCYVTGDVSGSRYVDSILGGQDLWNNSSTSIVNCYTTDATVKKLNGGASSEDAYQADVFSINDAYPVFKWENQPIEIKSKRENIKVGQSIDLGCNKDDLEESDWFEDYTFNVVWSSLNESVATVNNSGIVTGRGVGETTIVGKVTVSKGGVNQEYYIEAIVKVHNNISGAIATPKIEGGVYHFAALKEDGTVWTWGDNSKGQLGVGDTRDRKYPTKARGLNNVIDIACGPYHTLALKKDGTVWATGFNNNGQIGNGTTIDTSTFVQVSDLTDIIQISAGGFANSEFYNSYALARNGDVYAWGSDKYGQLGQENTDTEEHPKPLLMKAVSDVIKIDSKATRLIMLKNTGDVYGVGYNLNGNLGIGNTNNQTLPKKMTNESGNDLTGVKDIASGLWHTIIIRSDDSVWAAGYNKYGSLGDTTNTTSRTKIVQMKDSSGNSLTRGINIFAGSEMSYVLTKDQNKQPEKGMYVTGGNLYGQLFTGDTSNLNKATKVLSNMNILSVGSTNQYINANKVSQAAGAVIDKNGYVHTVGYNNKGQLGDGTTTNSETMVDVSIGRNEELNIRNEYIKIGETLTINALEESNFNVFIQGANNTNQVDLTWESSNEDVATVNNNGVVEGKKVGHTTITGYGPDGFKARAIINVYRNKAGVITTPDFQMGTNFTVTLKEDGTVWTTGLNDCGQLGNGTTTESNIPVQVKIDENTYLTNVKTIAVGKHKFVLAVTFDGKVYGWGQNDYGMLATNDYENQVYATELQLEDGSYLNNAIAVACADYHSMVLTTDGKVYVGGHNYWYQNLVSLEREDKIPYLVDTKLTDIVKIASGFANCAAMASNGITYVWGENECGELETREPPVYKTVLGNDIVDISLNGYKLLLLKEDGSLWGAGLNESGQLGLGNNDNRDVLTKITLPEGTGKIKYITGSAFSSLFSTVDGRIYVAGRNDYGQNSNGTRDESNRFTLMKKENGSDITDCLILGSGGYGYVTPDTITNNGYISENGAVYIAGDNTYGQFGNETSGEETSVNYVTKLGQNDVTLNTRNEYIKNGTTYTINVTKADGFSAFVQEGNNTAKSKWSWESSNEDVATVNENGVVEGKKVGHTTITGYGPIGLRARAIINVYRNKTGAITTPDLQIGMRFTAILKEDGTVWTTGLNDCGQLGNGTTTDSDTPVQVKIDENTYLTNVKSISVGDYRYVLAVTVDGKVYGWGENDYGQLATNDYENQVYAKELQLENGSHLNNAVAVSSGDGHSMVLTTDGKVYVTGHNYWYQNLVSLEREDQIPYLVDTQLTDMIKISTGFSGCASMASNGTTYVWGMNAYGELETRGSPSLKSSLGNDIVDINLNGFQTIILREDESLWGTGLNENGQLGLGDNDNRDVLTKITLPEGTGKIKYITGSDYSTLFSTVDGKMYVTGNNDYGQNSNGTTDESNTFTIMKKGNGNDVTDCLILGSGGHAYSGDYTSTNNGYIKNDGTVYLAGDNTYGQIGNGTSGEETSVSYLTKMGQGEVTLNARNEYIKIGDTFDIKILNAGAFNVFIQDEIEQDEWSWESSNEDVATVDDNGVVEGKTVGHTTITGYGPDGLKARVIINVYRNKTGAITVPQVAEGEDFTLVLKEDGTVWATGSNSRGQLGQGDTNDRNEPTRVKIKEEEYLENVKAISVGPDFAAALTMDKKVYVWGSNEYGSLGQGNTDDLYYATIMKGTDGTTELSDIIQISLGRHEIMALTSAGEIYGSGYGVHNIYLDGDTSNYHITTTKVEGVNNIAYMTCGVCDMFAMSSNGEIWSWGHNYCGELGNDRTDNSSPTKYLIGNDIVDVSSSGYATIIIKEDGTVWTTGKNDNGQLGLKDTDNRTVFEKVTLADNTDLKAKYVVMKEELSNVLGKDGVVYVTGLNSNEQLSQGNDDSSSTFIPMLNNNKNTVNDVLLLASDGNTYWYATSKTNTFIKNDGTVWAVGNNSCGQIGNGTNEGVNYLTKMGESEVTLNARNEYIKIGQELDINVLRAGDFNVFIQDEVDQSKWTWSSSNEDVATIDNDGKVKGKTVGYTTITGNGPRGLKARAIINVYNNKEGAITVPNVVNGEYYTAILREDGTVWRSRRK